MQFKLGLIGCGPHANRIYLKLIEKYAKRGEVKPAVLIDLKSQKTKIDNYLKGVNYKFDEIVYLDNNELNSEVFSKNTIAVLKKTLNRHKLDGIIISTEPKAHKKYCLWALKNNLYVLVDKPLTSPKKSSTSVGGAKKIRTDYLEILKAQKKSKGKIIIQCQRRYHNGYLFLIDYLSDFIKKFKIPITYIDIFHGDGCWVLPNEFFERENHPYKYGYGKLMHSGYHFVDLLAWILKLNHKILNYDGVEIISKPLKPSDLNFQLNRSFMKKTFGEKELKNIYKNYNLKKLKNFGELDSYSKFFFYKKNKLVTSCNLDLMQSSFTRRSWPELPLDTYKGNGRVRHERVNIEVGPLLNVQIHSYQAYEPRFPEKIKGFGNEDHFEIHIYRNKSLVQGDSFAKYDFGEKERIAFSKDKYYLGHNEQARLAPFLDLIKKRDSKASLQEQDLTIELMSLISLSMSRNYTKKNPLIKVKFNLNNHAG